MTPEELLQRIQRAYDEASSATVKPLPRWYQHPGVLAYETKDPQQYSNDQRRAVAARALSDIPLHELPPSIADQVSGLKYGEWDDTPYMPTGIHPKVLGPVMKKLVMGIDDRLSPRPEAVGRNPLMKGVTWAMSSVAVPAAASRALANYIDPGRYPSANQELASSANTALLFLPEDQGWVPENTPTMWSMYADEKRERGNRGWGSPMSAFENDLLKRVTDAQVDATLPRMADTLVQENVNPYVAEGLGLVSEIMLDPYGLVGGGAADAVRLARKGMHRNAVKSLATDAALESAVPAGAAGYGAYNQFKDWFHAKQH